ncbi:hypothetical protein TEA_009681 [Camellia sinensis var. sinensis]|uniref:Diacylglycerol kinase accessory domain-containing protein n=1 Tax=Camellia sinensis var. sinensis TaxID=542762 RepID=A0A4S4E0V9_CAMSN|nr:hypothetical protein TEA_009681 [Camellia sinensis var. sinensis]
MLRMYVKKVNFSEWEQVSLPSSVRLIVALNLNNYASGRNPWGNLKPEYLEKRGFVGAHVNDGLLEIFGLKQGWLASFVLSDLISAKHIAQHCNCKGLKNMLRMYVKKVNFSEWEQVSLPSSVRLIVALNLNNYTSGRNPWGNLKPEYLEKSLTIVAHVRHKSPLPPPQYKQFHGFAYFVVSYLFRSFPFSLIRFQALIRLIVYVFACMVAH